MDKKHGILEHPVGQVANEPTPTFVQDTRPKEEIHAEYVEHSYGQVNKMPHHKCPMEHSYQGSGCTNCGWGVSIPGSDWLGEVINDPDLFAAALKALERLDADPNRAESPKQWAKRMAALFIQVDEELTKLTKAAK